MERVNQKNASKSEIKKDLTTLLGKEVAPVEVMSVIMSNPALKLAFIQLVSDGNKDAKKLLSELLKDTGHHEMLLELSRQSTAVESYIIYEGPKTTESKVIIMQLNFERTGEVSNDVYDEKLINRLAGDSRFSKLLGAYVSAVGMNTFVDKFNLMKTIPDDNTTIVDHEQLNIVRKILMSVSPEKAAILIDLFEEKYCDKNENSGKDSDLGKPQNELQNLFIKEFKREVIDEIFKHSSEDRINRLIMASCATNICCPSVI